MSLKFKRHKRGKILENTQNSEGFNKYIIQKSGIVEPQKNE